MPTCSAAPSICWSAACGSACAKTRGSQNTSRPYAARVMCSRPLSRSGTNSMGRRFPFRLWPRTLVARLFLIFLIGLVLAHTLSFGLLFYERYDATKSLMLGNLERDVSIAVDILNRLPASERPEWLALLSSENRQYLLGPGN